MLARRIYVPSLNLPDEFGPGLHSFWQSLDRISTGTRAIFDFSRCRELHGVMMVVLAGAEAVLRRRRASARIDVDTISPQVMRALRESGCGAHFGIAPPPDRDPMFRHDLDEDATAILQFLEEQWLAKSGITMSDMLRNEVLGQVYEIYANAFEHGGSSVGVFTFGERLEDGSMALVVADFGVGIPKNAERAQKRKVTGAEALKWAFQPGTTTLAGNQRHPRGLGLTLLKSLVETNDGKLDITSHEGHSCVTSSEQTFRDISRACAATVVRLQLSSTGLHYVFQSELPTLSPKELTPW